MPGRSAGHRHTQGQTPQDLVGQLRGAEPGLAGKMNTGLGVTGYPVIQLMTACETNTRTPLAARRCWVTCLTDRCCHSSAGSWEQLSIPVDPGQPSGTTVSIGLYLPDQRSQRRSCLRPLLDHRGGTHLPGPIHRFQALLPTARFPLCSSGESKTLRSSALANFASLTKKQGQDVKYDVVTDYAELMQSVAG